MLMFLQDMTGKPSLNNQIAPFPAGASMSLIYSPAVMADPSPCPLTASPLKHQLFSSAWGFSPGFKTPRGNSQPMRGGELVVKYPNFHDPPWERFEAQSTWLLEDFL